MKKTMLTILLCGVMITGLFMITGCNNKKQIDNSVDNNSKEDIIPSSKEKSLICMYTNQTEGGYNSGTAYVLYFSNNNIEKVKEGRFLELYENEHNTKYEEYWKNRFNKEVVSIETIDDELILAYRESDINDIDFIKKDMTLDDVKDAMTTEGFRCIQK